MKSNLDEVRARTLPGSRVAAKVLAVAKGVPRTTAREGVEGCWIGLATSKGCVRSVPMVLCESRRSSLTTHDIAVELGIIKDNPYSCFTGILDVVTQCHMRCMDINLSVVHEILANLSKKGNMFHTIVIRVVLGMLKNGFGRVLPDDLDALTTKQRQRLVMRRDEIEGGVRTQMNAGMVRGNHLCEDVRRPISPQGHSECHQLAA